jgi:probable F420-dependent oxidoreductase
MHLGVMPAISGRGIADPGATTDFVHLVEELGCESLWTVEHVVIPETYQSSYPYDPSGKMSLAGGDDVPDPLDWLAFCAALTSRIKLGTAMLILPEHNPVTLAKRLATVDVLSGGRLIAGVGIGWLREEYDALGVPFERRGRRADEYLGALRALWTQAPASFDGEFVRFDGVHSDPRPTRPGGVPIVIGGHGPAAVRRAARYGDGFYPLGVDVAGLGELLEQLRAECAAIGRNPGEIEITARAPGKPEAVRALAELGVHRVVMRVFPADPAGVRADVERYQQEVLG